MAVGRPTIDPSWDDAGGGTPPASNQVTPPQGAPSTQSSTNDTQAIDVARATLQQQPTHEQLEPLETIDDRRETQGLTVSVPSLGKEDAATILDAPNRPPSDLATSLPGDLGTAPQATRPPGNQVTSLPTEQAASRPLASESKSVPDLEPPYDPTVPTADTLAKSLDQPTVRDQRSEIRDQAAPLSATARIPQLERTASLPAAERHLPLWIKIGLGLVFVAVVAAALYLGSEAGYLSLGIERLWGVSNRPTQALTSAAAAIGSAPSYAVEGDVTVIVGGSSSAADRTISTQFRQQVSSPASQLDSSWTVGPSVPGTILGPRLADGGTVRALLQSDGTALYARLNEGDQTTPSVKTDLNELSEFKLSLLSWSDLLANLASASSSHRLGGKTINGVKSKGYQLQVPAGTLLGSLSPALAALPDPVTVEVWLDSRRARPQLITVTGSIQTSGTVTGQVIFGRYGEAGSITLPTADRTEPGSLSDWLETNGIIGVQSPASRDATRRTNLDAIKQALDESAAAQTPFGYPVTRGIVHLDTDPSIQSALAPYLSSIPKDPQQPDRYYGYQSDGTTYRLTAVAEEAAGDDIEDVGGLKLIVRTNQ